MNIRHLLTQNEVNRFSNMINHPGNSNDCWLWTGSTDGRGYGKFKAANKYIGAHRLSYIIYYRDITP